MKKVIILLLLFCLSYAIQAQNNSDLSVLLAESQMQREKPMLKWKYYYGFCMYSLFKVYERTKNTEYLDFIEHWANSSMKVFTEKGKAFKTLDDMYPALVLLKLYEHTGNSKYLVLPKQIVNTLKTYPRNKKGGYLHMIRHDGQLWLDGIYMINVFLAKYGQLMNDASFYDEVTKQISVYTDLLRDKQTKLLYHAYTEGDNTTYFNPITKRSNEFWGRSMGWVMMATVEVLDIMPKNYKDRKEIIKRLKSLSDALIPFQDEKTGLWYQVTNRIDLERNWLESSSSAMFAYGMAKAVHLGILDKSYLNTALKAYYGLVKHKIFKDEEGLYTVKDICHGTVVGNLDYYLNRPPSYNNLRGLPAVILLSEELRQYPVVTRSISNKERKHRTIEKASAKASRYNVLDFGVIADGKTTNTHTIQILIEKLHKNDGGTIYFPSGNYLTGAITLKNKVYLELSANAILIGSSNLKDYPDNMPLIYAEKSRNIGVIGHGAINANGQTFTKHKETPNKNPKKLIQFENCRNIKITDITITNSPNGNLSFLNCDYVRLERVHILSKPGTTKTHGIDYSSSSNVHISDCYFNSNKIKSNETN